MTMAVALLGFLALILVLVDRILAAYQRPNSQIDEPHRQRRPGSRTINENRAEMPQKRSDILVSARRV